MQRNTGFMKTLNQSLTPYSATLHTGTLALAAQRLKGSQKRSLSLSKGFFSGFDYAQPTKAERTRTVAEFVDATGQP